MKRKWIESMTAEETAAMQPWAEKWIAVGLRTGESDREKFAANIAICYDAAGLPPPKRIVWTTSPLALSLAGPISAYILAGGDQQNAVEIQEVIKACWHRYLGGQFWVGGWYWGSPSYVSFMLDILGLELDPKIERNARAYQAVCESACWFWPHREFVIVSERPTAIHRDRHGSLHHESEAAISWPDGWGIYSWHGVTVPSWVILAPDKITVEQIEAEQNAEVRRAMTERYGITRYVTDAKFEVIDQCKDPLGQPIRLLRRDELLAVELYNSTPDPDGSRRVYHVPCHPELRPIFPDGNLGEPQELTAINAVASTYGKRGEEYVLEEQT